MPKYFDDRNSEFCVWWFGVAFISIGEEESEKSVSEFKNWFEYCKVNGWHGLSKGSDVHERLHSGEDWKEMLSKPVIKKCWKKIGCKINEDR